MNDITGALVASIPFTAASQEIRLTSHIRVLLHMAKPYANRFTTALLGWVV